MKIVLLALSLALALGLAALEFASADPFGDPDLEVGAKAPGFRLNDQHGEAVRFKDVGKDKWVVVAFYPKSRTPG